MLNAQTNISLKINHLLGNQDFVFNKDVTTSGNYAVNVIRMEYYISQMKLVHDGGQEETLSNTYFLVDAGTSFNEALGNYNITKLEAVKFSIGVDNLPTTNPNDSSGDGTNHADPSLWIAGHPLAPKAPSMHWGWSSGYRFVAMEGKTGIANSFTYEIHALGDNNYYETEIELNIEAIDGKIEIELNADYLKSLENIDVSSGLITHGSKDEAIPFLKNFRDSVFTKRTGEVNTTDIQEPSQQFEFSVGPNPSNGQNITLNYSQVENYSIKLKIIDINGRVIKDTGLQGTTTHINIDTPGFYTLQLIEGQRVFAEEKIVVTY